MKLVEIKMSHVRLLWTRLIKGLYTSIWSRPFFYMFVCFFVRCTFSLPLTVFLPPPPKFQCPNFLDCWNPWGKSNGKKWFLIWKLFLKKGVRSPLQKKFFTGFFFICSFGFAPTSGTPVSKLFRFLKSLGKSIGKK